ncbi:mobile mystery protein A [Pseudidiomarina gelatinasegens]|uniref:Mobile mystery protein A n=1 Tax=Pseudidiomarina gelatinasegens TaxID=2487740 RepID=A0A443YZ27_9GAMM|nr:mobile mystery protein A [Pseudidiomarina gelatinasegens]RWU09484.1 mobile mystery protein A [Pseudidiomarina gelatinasegens]
MSVKNTVKKQYVQIVNSAAKQLVSLRKPPEGWLSVLRKALGMSGAQVAIRAGVSRNAIYQAERNETDGAITIKQMQKFAEAMGGRFVYAIVPENGAVSDIIQKQARRKAEDLIKRASAHMALEKQSLTSKQTAQRIDDLANEFIRDMPADFWEVK